MSRRRAVGGFATVGFLAAVAASLVVVAGVANLVVVHWAHGVVHSALDEAARAGSVAADAAATCTDRGEGALDDLLDGRLRGGVTRVRCTDDGTQVTASVDATFPSWFPAVPDWTTSVTATVVREPQS